MGERPSDISRSLCRASSLNKNLVLVLILFPPGADLLALSKVYERKSLNSRHEPPSCLPKTDISNAPHSVSG